MVVNVVILLRNVLIWLCLLDWYFRDGFIRCCIICMIFLFWIVSFMWLWICYLRLRFGLWWNVWRFWMLFIFLWCVVVIDLRSSIWLIFWWLLCLIMYCWCVCVVVFLVLICFGWVGVWCLVLFSWFFCSRLMVVVWFGRLLGVWCELVSFLEVVWLILRNLVVSFFSCCGGLILLW